MGIHILGNGPSIAEFNRTYWPAADVVVGCNFSDTKHSPDYTVIVDVRAMKQFRGGVDRAYHLSIPAVLSDRAYQYIEKTRGGWDRIPDGVINIIEVIPLIRDRGISRRLAGNSGQHGADHSIRKYPEQNDTVHIWGCDSFWGTDIRSATDMIVGQSRGPDGSRDRPGIIGPWRLYWDKVFNTHKGTSHFIIHTTKGVDPARVHVANENVTVL